MRRSIIVALVPFLLFLSSANAIAMTAAEVFEKASKSVVVVKIQDEKGKDIALGSGVVLPGGDVATNCHVIEKAVGITVYQGERRYHAVPRYIDYDRDVCSLSVQDMKAPAISIGSTKTLKVGSRVYAIGTPQGLTLTLSEGIISSLRLVEGGQYLQITAPISPGSSGGGLFDEEGRLVGLTTFYLADGQQLNFAVPVEWIGELAKRNKNVSNTAETSVDWLNKAMALQEKKDWRELINHALQRIKALPRSAVAWYALGIAYGNSGQTAKAIEANQQVLRINSGDAGAWYNLGVDYGESGQTAKAIEAYKQALRIKPEDAAAWYNLGVDYSESGQIIKAIEAYKQALRIKPEDAVAWYNLGVDYGKSGQTTKAIEAYQQALRINPEDSSIWHNLGIVYDKSSQTTKAIEAYQQALRINPEYVVAWYNLGVAYGKSGQTTKAIEAYQQALRINPEYVVAWYNLGVAYYILGQTGQVTEVYKRLKIIDSTMADKFFKNVIIP